MNNINYKENYENFKELLQLNGKSNATEKEFDDGSRMLTVKDGISDIFRLFHLKQGKYCNKEIVMVVGYPKVCKSLSDIIAVYNYQMTNKISINPESQRDLQPKVYTYKRYTECACNSKQR